MSEQVDWIKILAEEEDDSAATERIVSFPRLESPWIDNMGYKEFIGYDLYSERIVSFPRPESPWIDNMGYKEFIGYDLYSETLIPTSPLMSPHRHHQLSSPSSPLWNNNIAADHYNIDTSFAKQINAKTRSGAVKVFIRASLGEYKKCRFKAVKALKIAVSLFQVKVVIRASMGVHKKCRFKAVRDVKIAVSLLGVESAGLQGAEQDQIQVIGEGIDAGELTTLLGKKVGPSEIFSFRLAAMLPHLKLYYHKSPEEEVARSHDVGNSTPKLKDKSLSENIVEANSFNHLCLTTTSTSPPGAVGCTLEGCNRSSVLVNLEVEEVTLLTSREIMDEQLHLSLPLTQTTEPVKSALVQLETLPDQIDMMIPSLSELQTHVGTSAQNLTATTMVEKQKKRKLSSTTGGRSKKSISLEDLQRHSHLSLKETARSLHVSKSTLKRRCRENGISEWSELKDLNVSEKSEETGAINLDVDSIIVKVYGGDNIIKLELSSSSNKVDLEKEVATLLNLEVGSFRLKYEDEDSDWVLIARDFNWRDCKHTSRSLGKTVIKLLVSQSI